MSPALVSVSKNDHTTLAVADQDVDSPPDSPSFPTTSRIDDPRSLYLPPDEGNTAFLMPSNSGHILRRRRSHLKRWIEDQQHVEPDDFFDDPESPVERVGTPCNPYLAYPHLSVASLHPKTLNEVGSLHNYVVIDDVLEDQSGVDADHISVDSDGAEHMSPPASPVFNGSPQSFPSKMGNSPSSFRNFNLFGPARASAISLSGESSASRHSSRLSLFRSPRQSTSITRGIGRHNKSSSLSTLNLTPKGISSEDSVRCTSSASPNWRWRPSVRGHFSSYPTVPHIQIPNSESLPSISSNNSYSSVLTPPTTQQDEDAECLSIPSKTVHIDSVQSRGMSPNRALFQNKMSTASVPSLWSSVLHAPEASGSSSALVHKESAIRIPFSPKSKHAELAPASTDDDTQIPVENISRGPQIVYARAGKGSASRVSLSSLSSPRDKRKKKLIVSGIGVNDVQRLEAMKEWCESFGEVTQITRIPNGDLHVHFRKAEVAETVCRVRARVTISGVGSVQLSWFTGDKR